MHFPRKSERAFEWNFNTLLQLLSILVMLLGGWTIWVNLRRDVVELQEWKTSLIVETKERRGQIEANFARVSTQASTLDERLDAQEAAVGRLSDRVSAAEARSAEFAQTLRELQSSINQQSGDLKVILAWIEEQRRYEETRK